MALCALFPRCVEHIIALFPQGLKEDLEDRAPFVPSDYNLYSVSAEAHHCLENLKSIQDHGTLSSGPPLAGGQ